MNPISRLVLKAKSVVLSRIAPEWWKGHNELSYWKQRKAAEGELAADHYEHFYTGFFGIDRSEYTNKFIVDIGCGPRGSLEWADMAARRIGVDPLAGEYEKLREKPHQMEYIESGSESIPLDSATCDALFSFNSLDHVADVTASINEIKRLVKPGGLFLLIVDVNHTPTACEPHRLTPSGLLDAFAPQFDCLERNSYKPTQSSAYKSIRDNQPFSDPLQETEEGFFTAKFRRVE